MSQPVVPEPVADPQRPWKALVPVVFAAIYAVIEAVQISVGDGAWDNDDTIAVVISLVTAVGVYLTKNPIVRGANGL